MNLRAWSQRFAGTAPERRAWSPQQPPYGVTRHTGSTAVGYERALAHGAVYGCVDLIVRLVAWQMPVTVTRDGGAVGAPAPVVPAPTVIANPHPHPWMTAKHWRASMIESAMMRGYAAGLVTEQDRSGWPQKIMPVHPDLVTWTHRNGRVEWKANGKPAEVWDLGGDLWIAPAFRVTGSEPIGRSPVAAAADAVGLGFSARKFGRDFFDAAGLPVTHGKMVTADGNIPETVATTLKQRVIEATRNREPLITGSGFTLDTIPVNAEESQFLDTIQANVAQVCMFFGVPPESIGGTSGDGMTYANVEGRNLQLLTNTAGAWMQWSEDILTQLIPGQTVGLDPQDMLRTSTAAQFATAKVGLDLLTLNEARAILGYPPVDGGDTAPKTTGTAPESDLVRKLQQIYLAVGTVITVDEARKILNEDGAGLVIPAPPLSGP